MTVRLLRFSDVEVLTGRPRSTLERDIADGIFPPGVKLGQRAVAWPEYEVDQINRAVIAGKSPDELRELVRHIVSKRRTA